MDNFNSNKSTRKTRKVNQNIYTQKKRNLTYDSNGVHITSGKNVCDCLDEECPGCHFPCPKCESLKCGHECRNSRRWQYEQYKIDGTHIVIKNLLRK